MSRCATCPLGNMDETKRLCDTSVPQACEVTTHVADVSDEARCYGFAMRWRSAKKPTISICCSTTPASAVAAACRRSRDEWERTFNVCWRGVYYNTRAFLPMLQGADEAHIVNTSSVNGFWASLGPRIPIPPTPRRNSR